MLCKGLGLSQRTLPYKLIGVHNCLGLGIIKANHIAKSFASKTGVGEIGGGEAPVDGHHNRIHWIVVERVHFSILRVSLNIINILGFTDEKYKPSK